MSFSFSPLSTAEVESQKRIFDTLDSLFKPSGANRRRCIYPVPERAPSVYTSSHSLPPLPEPSLYAPYSPLALLARLRTFQPSTFAPSHPFELSPLTLSKNGWINSGREVLHCGRCEATCSLSGLEEIRDERVRREVRRRLGTGVGERHASGCAWRVRTSPG